ncbi:MAG: hypothetical protein GXP62_10415 [Oligoflexia bacterium]|nr:hypothetical protein [Oligoflexia bacterium]
MDRFLHHPYSELVLIGLIATAVLAVLAEEATRGMRIEPVFARISDATAVVFAIELSLRFWVAPRKRTFFLHYSVDLLAILPLYRPLRLFRVLMLLRLFRAGVLLNRRMRVLGGLLRSNRSELTIMATLSVTMVLVAAVVLHASTNSIAVDAQGLDPHGLPGAIWYSLFTLVAADPVVGAPTSHTGRVVTFTLMLGGLTVFGIFVGTISATMAAALTERMEFDVINIGELNDHILVFGWNPAGPTMLRELLGPGEANHSVVVVFEAQHEPPELADLRSRHDRLHFKRADYTCVDVLEKLGIPQAHAVIILTDMTGDRPDADRDARAVLAALTVEKLAEGIYVCCELINGQHEDLLQMSGVEAVVIRDWFAGALMGSFGRSRGMAAVIGDLLTTTSGNAIFSLTVPERLNGATVLVLHQELKRDHGAVLVSLDRAGQDTIVNPDSDMLVRAEDQVFVISRHPVKL